MHLTPFIGFYPNLNQLAAEPALFDLVRERYQNLQQTGFFLENKTKAIYLYEIQTVTRTYRGLLGCVDVEAYLNGAIKKHENTLLQEEHKQMKLTLERQAAVKPVLLAYPAVPQIDRWVAEYIMQHPVFLEMTFTKDQQIHRLWAVQKNADIQELQTLFATQVPHAYIADGHHRMCAMALIAKTIEDKSIKAAYQNVYCAFFPSSELEILAFNRIVEIPEHVDLTALQPFFEIKPLAEPTLPIQKHKLTLRTATGWFLLQWKEAVLQEFTNETVVLDTQLWNEKVLRNLLGIEDVRHDKRVTYVEAPKSLAVMQAKISEYSNRWGFCLHPIAFQDLVDLVENGGTLPPKSTWFEPRMKNGLLVKHYGKLE